MARFLDQIERRGPGWKLAIESARTAKAGSDWVAAVIGFVTLVASFVVAWNFGLAWGLALLLAAVLVAVFVTGRRVQQVLDVRNEVKLRFSDYEFMDAIGPSGTPNAAILQGAFLVHNDGPDSEFEAWVPHSAIDWAGPTRLYGGFHLCWQLSTSPEERRRWIPRGSSERVDVVIVDTSTRSLRFLGPGRRLYMELQQPNFVVTGTIEIRDVKRDGVKIPVEFKLTYRPDEGVATFRVPADAQVEYGPGGLPMEPGGQR